MPFSSSAPISVVVVVQTYEETKRNIWFFTVVNVTGRRRFSVIRCCQRAEGPRGNVEWVLPISVQAETKLHLELLLFLMTLLWPTGTLSRGCGFAKEKKWQRCLFPLLLYNRRTSNFVVVFLCRFLLVLRGTTRAIPTRGTELCREKRVVYARPDYLRAPVQFVFKRSQENKNEWHLFLAGIFLSLNCAQTFVTGPTTYLFLLCLLPCKLRLVHLGVVASLVF